jgi:hypothetical protein
VLCVGCDAGEEIRGDGPHAQAQKILDLTEEDTDRNSSGESCDHRLRHVFHQGPDPQDPGCDQHETCQQCAQDESAVPEALDDPEDHGDKGGRGTANLHARPAERRDQEAGDDGGLKSLLRRRPGGDRKCHGERQRDDGDRKAGDGVVPEVIPSVPAPQDGDDLGNVKMPSRRGRRYDGHDPGRAGDTSGGRNRAIAPLAGSSGISEHLQHIQVTCD